jgi:hypothetical protein
MRLWKADSCAMARRESANQDDTTLRFTTRQWRANLASDRAAPAESSTRAGSPCHFGLKNPLSIASRGARRLGDLPKNCHLLPSTAILEQQNRYTCFNRSVSSLPIEGMPASLSLVIGYYWSSFLCPHSLGRRRLAAVGARRATLPDPRLARRGLAGCRQLDPSHPALASCEDVKVEPCPLRATSRVEACAYSSRFIGRRVLATRGFYRHKAPKIGDLCPRGVRSDHGELALESIPGLPKSATAKGRLTSAR